MNKTSSSYFVGITGGSASGKSFFLQQLISYFKEGELTYISHDNYYREQNEQPLDENGIHNYDTPYSVDDALFYNDLIKLKEGKQVEKEEYTFNNPALTPKMITFRPSPIIIVEGIFVFYYKKIADLMDMKLFIDAREHIKLKRRIIRDNKERGYDLDDVLYRYERHVMPTYDQYIEPFKHQADLIVPNNHSFDCALEVIASHLKLKLNNHA